MNQQDKNQEISPRDVLDFKTAVITDHKMPTTSQANQILLETEKVINNTQTDGLSGTGKKVLGSTQNIIETSRKILINKNPKDDLQELIYHVTKASKKVANENDISEQGKQAVKQAKEEVKDLASLVTLFLKSKEFRDALNEVIDISKDLSEYAKELTTETYSSSVGIVKQGIDQVSSSVKASVGEVKDQMAENNDTGRDLFSTVNDLGKSQRVNSNVEMALNKTTEKLKDTTFGQQANEVFSSLPPTSQIVDKLDETKKEVTDIAKSKGEELKKEVKPSLEKLVESIRLCIIRLRKRESFVEGVEYLQSILHEMYERLQNLSVDVVSDNVNVPQDASYHLRIAREKSIMILENFSGYHLDKMFEALNNLFSVYQKDSSSQVVFHDSWDIVLHMLNDKDYLQKEQFKKDAQKLVEMTTSQLNLYKEYLDTFISEVQNFFGSIAEDRLLRQYASDWSDLMVQLFLDPIGRPVFKPELLTDIPKLIGALIQNIAIIPVPEINSADNSEMQDSSIDFKIDNINIAAQGLLPNNARVVTETDVDFNETGSGFMSNKVNLQFTIPQVSASNINFAYKRDSLPKISDNGLLDLEIDNINVNIGLTFYPWTEKNNFELFTIDTVRYDIRSVHVKMDEVKHKAIYTLLYPVIKSQVKHKIQQQLEKQTREYLGKFKLQLVNLKRQGIIAYENRMASESSEVREYATLPSWSSEKFNV